MQQARERKATAKAKIKSTSGNGGKALRAGAKAGAKAAGSAYGAAMRFLEGPPRRKRKPPVKRGVVYKTGSMYSRRKLSRKSTKVRG